MQARSDLIQRRRLHEHLLERLLEKIRAGDPLPGGVLPSEQQLMEQFGVGRPAVREALLLLESMGVIAISHGERARVLPPSAGRILERLNESIVHLLTAEPRNLEHLKQARIAFEQALVREATLGMTDAALALLGESLERQQRAVDSGAGYHEEDMAFHAAIAAGAGNPLYPVFLRAILDWLSAFYKESVRIEGMAAVSLAEHRAIYAAMLGRKPDRAARAMKAHLLRSSSRYGPHRSRRPRPDAT